LWRREFTVIFLILSKHCLDIQYVQLKRPIPENEMVTEPSTAFHQFGDKKPWRLTPLIESAKLSKEAEWYVDVVVHI
jgi:hypothetical protein